jgi:hypothetical protein
MSPAAVVSRVRRNGARRLVRLAAGLDREHPSATIAG